MPVTRLLIANRGEIAIRIARSAAELGIATVAVHSADDAQSLHVRAADEARALSGQGAAAYLDAAQVVAVAREAGCDAIHPGYGFISENAGFARLCAAAGIAFVGPQPEVLDLFGDKAQARRFAAEHGVDIVAGTDGPTTLAQAQAFLADLGPGGAIMVKALAGGGGRGMRPVTEAALLPAAFERCRAEALSAFGNGDVYVERLFVHPRHVEVQVLGDGTGAVAHLWERECSIQRERQKIVEIAPAPFLRPAVRDRLLAAAVKLASAAKYRGAGTFEFLVDAAVEGDGAAIAFIEANARLQVEHTVTEEVTGVDLVAAQLGIAGGATLAGLGLTQAEIPAPRGMALQARVNLETMQPDGSVKGAGGVLSAYDPPSGLGVRVDGYGYAGYRTNPRFDSLLAKVIVHARTGDFSALAAKAGRALAEFRLAGAASNIGFLQALLAHPALLAGRLHTNFVAEHIAALTAAEAAPAKWFAPAGAAAPRRAGARLESRDPLAIVDYGKETAAEAAAAEPGDEALGPEGTVPLRAPMQGTIVSLSVADGATVQPGQEIMVMEAMKMQHSIAAAAPGIVRGFVVETGETVFEGAPLAFIEERPELAGAVREAETIDLDHIRPDLAEVLERHRRTRDEARPKAVARRRATGQRTARENISDLVDSGTFVEYGALTLAARRRTHSVEQLVEESPADGIILGLGTVNGQDFPEEKGRAAVAHYDYTVMAGTQGRNGHRKQDRFFELAHDLRIPVVLFAEGGGGRGSDSDAIGGSETDTFYRFAALSGGAPVIGIASGKCFAGNAVMLGCCDVIIATANANIGMAGPAMIEGGGLGVYRPEEIGPMSVQVPSGVVDIAVADEPEAVRVAKQYLSYFQGAVKDWSAGDQRLLRHIVPENRLRGYDMRTLIGTLADEGSMLEIRRGWGLGMITALIRVEGKPMGVIANNPMHLGGAVDSDAADKAARFMQMCDAHDIPILSLNDNPGNMVGPEAEKTALVRHCCRSYLIGANIDVPLFFVIIRKAIGLGKLAMTGGGMKKGVFAVSWPTGEFAGMGIEGQVKLGRRKELAAIADTAERIATYERFVAELYDIGKALNTGSHCQVDDVIDPAETRRWILAGLRSLPPRPVRHGKKRPWVDGW
jgi:acetyl/propionyl-CoA carboxylase alpha subunit/acetyl-CoA carboxylase carboxyltransferase component